MATSAEIGLAALGAFAASEASGVTDVTSLGRGGDRSGDEGGGDTPAGLPGLGALQAQIGGLRGAVARAGVNAPESGDASQLDLAAAFERAVGAGAASVDVADPNQNLTRTVEVVRDAAGGNVPSLTGGGGSGVPGGAFGILGGRLGGFDPDAAGEAFGRGVGDVVEGTVSESSRGVGEAIGSVPFNLVGGAIKAGGEAGNATRRVIADVTGAEGDDTGVNADRPGAGITDVLDMVASGEQGDPSRTYTPGEAVGAIGGAASSAATRDGTSFDPGALVDAADTSDAAARNTRGLAERIGRFRRDLVDDGRLDEPIIGGDSGSRDRNPTGGGANAATGSTSPSIARNADEAAAGGDPAGDPSTTSSDTERDDALDDVRRAAATGRRRIGVIR